MFNAKEQEIIKWGLQNGKSKDEVTQAIANYRTGMTSRELVQRKQAQATQTFAQDTVSDIGQIGSDVKKSWEDRSIKSQDAITAMKEGKQGIIRTAGQLFGQGAGLASDVIGSATKGVAKAVLPQEAENAIKGGITAVTTPIMGFAPVQSVLEKYNNLDEKTKRDIDALIGVSSLATEITGAGIAGKGIKKGVETAGKVISKTTENIAKTGKNIAKGSVKATEKLVQKPIPMPVETALKDVDLNIFDKYATKAFDAAKDYKNATPLEVAGDSAKQALSTINKKLNEIGKNKAKATKNINDIVVGLPHWREIQEFTMNAKTALKRKVAGLGLKVENNGIISQATGKVSRIPMKSSDITLLKQTNEILQRAYDNPTFTNLDNAIDSVQELLYKRKGSVGSEPINRELEGIIKQQIGSLNTKLKEFGSEAGRQFPLNAGKFGDYTKMNDDFSRIVKIRNELNTKLGKGGERGGSLMKRVFSPSDANTKKLFQQVKEITGIDLVNEATIAKYVMEAVGDARQLSLLEELKLPRFSKAGVLDWAWEQVTKKSNTPEKMIQRAREITNSKKAINK